MLGATSRRTELLYALVGYDIYSRKSKRQRNNATDTDSDTAPIDLPTTSAVPPTNARLEDSIVGSGLHGDPRTSLFHHVHDKNQSISPSYLPSFNTSFLFFPLQCFRQIPLIGDYTHNEQTCTSTTPPPQIKTTKTITINCTDTSMRT